MILIKRFCDFLEEPSWTLGTIIGKTFLHFNEKFWIDVVIVLDELLWTKKGKPLQAFEALLLHFCKNRKVLCYFVCEFLRDIINEMIF